MIYRLILLTTLLSVAGCGEQEAVIRSSTSLAQSFAPDSTPPPPPLEPTSAPRVRIIVDASESMAGFVGCRSATTTYDHILDRLATSLGVTRVVLFGDARDRAPLFSERGLGRELHCPATYNRLQNPDFKLVERLEADSTEWVTIYLTDGVQSAVQDATPTPTVVALQRWIAEGRTLAILSFRSAFSGRAWSERLGQMLGAAQAEERPFHAFIFAPSDQALEAVLDRLPESLFGAATITRIGQASPECRVIPTRLTITGQKNPPWVLLPTEVADSLAARRYPIGEFECQMPPHHPLATVHPRVAMSEYRRWRGTEFSQPTRPPGGTSFAADSFYTQAGSSRAVLSALLPKAPEGNYGFYALQAEAHPGRIRDDLVALSTDDDGSASKLNHTYRFLWLLDHLVRAQFERSRIERPYFVTVQYR